MKIPLAHRLVVRPELSHSPVRMLLARMVIIKGGNNGNMKNDPVWVMRNPNTIRKAGGTASKSQILRTVRRPTDKIKRLLDTLIEREVITETIVPPAGGQGRVSRCYTLYWFRNILPAYLEKMERMVHNKWRTLEKRKENRKERESSLSVYIHIFLLISQIPFFPYLIFFSLF